MRKINTQNQLMSIVFSLLILGGALSQSFASGDQLDSSDTSEINRSCNCIAFRLDDVQNFWLNDVQIKIIDNFHERKVPLTIGVIGNGFGDDEKLLNLIKEKMASEFDLEIANHGWKHEDFSKYSQEEQSDLLSKSNKAIHESLGVSPTIFIPPLNNFNNGTLKAMEENNIRIFSTELDENNDTYEIKGSSMLHFPEGASTGVLNKEIIRFEGLSSEAIFIDVLASLDVYGFVVVTLHPQEFSTIEKGTYSNSINQNQINELNFLIDNIKEKGYETVLLSQIMDKSRIIEINREKIPSWAKTYAEFWSNEKISDEQFAKGLNHLEKIEAITIPTMQTTDNMDFEPQIPPWVKNNAKWWSEDLVSDREYLDGIQFLISHKIIKV